MCSAVALMAKNDGELSMMVLPPHYLLDCEGLENEISAHAVSSASEWEFSHRFPRCEVGAMPPFGHLYGLQAYISQRDDIAFNAGSHTEVIRMPMAEYMRLAFADVVGQGVIAPLD